MWWQPELIPAILWQVLCVENLISAHTALWNGDYHPILLMQNWGSSWGLKEGQVSQRWRCESKAGWWALELSLSHYLILPRKGDLVWRGAVPGEIKCSGQRGPWAWFCCSTLCPAQRNGSHRPSAGGRGWVPGPPVLDSSSGFTTYCLNGPAQDTCLWFHKKEIMVRITPTYPFLWRPHKLMHTTALGRWWKINVTYS